jgi:hypothetical protein
MKVSGHLLVATFALFGIAACTERGTLTDSGRLTNDKAAAALKQWMPACNSTVTGIQELPQQNVAKADLNLSNCPFFYSNVNSPTGGGTINYTGHGEAVFTHYNDGRWVMTQVSAKDRWPYFQWNGLNIEAK